MNRDKELIPFSDEVQALKNLVSLLNFRNTHQIKLDLQLASTDFHIVPGSLLIAVDSITRNTLFLKNTSFVMSIYEEEDHIVLHHKINERLILHEESIQAFARIQRVYSFFSDIDFVQVKAYGENYIKFPAIKISESITIASEG